MLDVIVAIIGAFFTSILSIFMVRKYTLVNSDAETVKKVFLYQKEIYLNIVASKDGKPVPINTAKTKIDELLVEIKEDDDLFLIISEELKQCLKIYKDLHFTKETIQLTQKQIERDFEETKYKLGYPNNIYDLKIFNVIKIIQLSSIFNIVFFIFVWKTNLYSNADTLMPLFYLAMFSLFVLILSRLYSWEHPTFEINFRKNAKEYFHLKTLKWRHKIHKIQHPKS